MLSASEQEAEEQRRAKEEVWATAASRATEIQRLTVANLRLAEEHLAEMNSVRRRNAEAVAKLEEKLEYREKDLEALRAEVRQAEQYGAATRVNMSTRLRALAKEKARKEKEAAEQQQRLRAGQAALEQERRVDNERANEKIRTVEREKADEAAMMKMKLDKLKRLQELALGSVSTSVERATAGALPSASGSGNGPPKLGAVVAAQRKSTQQLALGSQPPSRTRGRQLLYWEIVKSKIEQSPPAAQQAMVTAAIDREKGILERYGAAI